MAWLAAWSGVSAVEKVLPALIAGIALASAASAWFAFPIHVTSNSMVPYVHAGDYGVAVYTGTIRRGDVVVFRLPFGARDLAIKRAMALAGDCVPTIGAAEVMPPNRAWACPTVAAGTVYLIGDNAGHSLDSRHFGAVPVDQIVGKMVLRLPVTQWLGR